MGRKVLGKGVRLERKRVRGEKGKNTVAIIEKTVKDVEERSVI